MADPGALIGNLQIRPQLHQCSTCKIALMTINFALRIPTGGRVVLWNRDDGQLVLTPHDAACPERCGGPQSW